MVSGVQQGRITAFVCSKQPGNPRQEFQVIFHGPLATKHLFGVINKPRKRALILDVQVAEVVLLSGWVCPDAIFVVPAFESFCAGCVIKWAGKHTRAIGIDVFARDFVVISGTRWIIKTFVCRREI